MTSKRIASLNTAENSEGINEFTLVYLYIKCILLYIALRNAIIEHAFRFYEKHNFAANFYFST